MGSWLSGSPGSRAVWARLRRLVPSPPHTGVRPASAQPRPEHPSLPAPSTGVSPEESPGGPRTYTDSRLSPAAPLHGTPVPQGPTTGPHPAPPWQLPAQAPGELAAGAGWAGPLRPPLAGAAEEVASVAPFPSSHFLLLWAPPPSPPPFSPCPGPCGAAYVTIYVTMF